MTASAASLRADEVRYRALGRFELAVQYQRQADIFEAGGNPATSLCSIFDRGALGPVVSGRIGHLAAFELPSGLVWALTEDRLRELLAVLIFEAKVTTPIELCAIALELAEDEKLAETVPKLLRSAWEQGWAANDDGQGLNPYAATCGGDS